MVGGRGWGGGFGLVGGPGWRCAPDPASHPGRRWGRRLGCRSGRVRGFGARCGSPARCEVRRVGADGPASLLITARQAAARRDLPARRHSRGAPRGGRLVRPDQRRDSVAVIMQTDLGTLAGTAARAAQLLRMTPGQTPPTATRMVAAEFLFVWRIVTRSGAVTHSGSRRPAEQLKLLEPHEDILSRLAHRPLTTDHANLRNRRGAIGQDS